MSLLPANSKEILTGRKEGFFPNTIPHNCQRDVSKKVEHNDNRKPHLPGVDVILVEIPIIPANGKVISSSHNPCSANSVVCSNVRDDGNFGRHTDVREQEFAEQRGKGSRDVS